MGTRKTLVSTLIQCHMDYACSAWYTGLSKRNKSRLQTAQNKLIRFILQLSARSHVGYSEFKMAGMLPVEKRVTQLQPNHIFNIVHGNAPNYLKSNFIFNEHSFNTRSSTLSFIVPNVTTNYGKSTFVSTGIKAWNSLPSALHNITEKMFFKKSVKEYLFTEILSNELNEFTV